jgi:hypothetical protein
MFGFVTTESTPAMRTRALDAGTQFMIGNPFTPQSSQCALQPMLQD